MLVPYTKISDLSPEQKQRLKAMLSRVVLEGRTIFEFEGAVLSINEVKAQKRVWEGEGKPSSRQVLLG